MHGISVGTEFRTFWFDVGDKSNLGLWTPSPTHLAPTETCAQPCAHMRAAMTLKLSVGVIGS